MQVSSKGAVSYALDPEVARVGIDLAKSHDEVLVRLVKSCLSCRAWTEVTSISRGQTGNPIFIYDRRATPNLSARRFGLLPKGNNICIRYV